MSLDLAEMFGFDVSPLVLFLRTSVVYLILISAVRVLGRREMGSMGLPDLLMIVLIADGLQNAMAANYTSVSGGLTVAGTLLFWNWALDFLSIHIPFVNRLVHPKSLVLVEDGLVNRRNLKRELITEEELAAQLRVQGIQDMSEVRRARIEPDGEMSVEKRKTGSQEDDEAHKSPPNKQQSLH